MKERVKKIFGYVIVAIVFSGIGAYAANVISSSDIAYQPQNNEFNVTNVKEALDKMYNTLYPACGYRAGETWLYGYTGSAQEFKVPCNGKYKIELWGASGRNSGNQGTPGLGGYTSGEIELDASTTLYVYVGEVGNCTADNYGTQTFNGGGYTHRCNAGDVGRGGGATDVRLVSGAWNNFDSLKSRIMVAGGGGSANVSNKGGDAGGLVSYVSVGGGDGAAPATQTSGYGFGSGGPGLGSQAYSGSGGGYWGGKSSTASPCTISYGGSSYISGHIGCDSIAASSTSSSLSFTGSAIHNSGMYFTNTTMIDGKGYSWTTSAGSTVVGMPTIDGQSTMTGNTGSGYAKITLLSLK